MPIPFASRDHLSTRLRYTATNLAVCANVLTLSVHAGALIDLHTILVFEHLS